MYTIEHFHALRCTWYNIRDAVGVLIGRIIEFPETGFKAERIHKDANGFTFTPIRGEYPTAKEALARLVRQISSTLPPQVFPSFPESMSPAPAPVVSDPSWASPDL